LLNGGLFTRDFLVEGICGTDVWAALNDATVADLRARLEALLAVFRNIRNPTRRRQRRN
jgi:hypothetical protein